MERYIHGGEPDNTIEYDFSVNVNPLGMPKEVKAVLTENLDKLEYYPDINYTELKEAIARHEGIEAEGIICGNGVSELIMAVCEAIHPAKTGIIRPCFYGYERAARAVSSQVIGYGNCEMIAEEASELDLIFICNPGNPDGRLIDRAVILKVLDEALKCNIKVVIDESFIDFTSEKSMVRDIEAYPNLLVLKAFTKFYGMPGIRLGYMCGNKELLAAIEGHCGEWHVSTMAQLAGIAALGAKDYAVQSRKLIKKERDYLTKELKGLGIEVFPADANFILLRSEYMLFEELGKRGIRVRDCSNFEGLDESYIRICVGLHPKNQILIKAIADIVKG